MSSVTRKSKSTSTVASCRIWLLCLIVLLMVGCREDYTEISKSELTQAFQLNSSPTFLGFAYLGSDTYAHYFVSRWRYQPDQRFKISRKALPLTKAMDYGSGEIRLSVLDHSKAAPIFCQIDGRAVYVVGEDE